MKKIILTLLIAIPLTLSMHCGAASLTFNLVDVVFDDGGIAAGSFDFETDTRTYSNININVSGGDQSDFSYSDADFYASYSGLLVMLHYLPGGETQRLIGLQYESPLASGTIPFIYRTSEALLTGDPNNPAWERLTVSGSVSTVPIPAAAWLFGSALLGLGIVKRKNA